jgi:hypothetical protein
MKNKTMITFTLLDLGNQGNPKDFTTVKNEYPITQGGGIAKKNSCTEFEHHYIVRTLSGTIIRIEKATGVMTCKEYGDSVEDTKTICLNDYMTFIAI